MPLQEMPLAFSTCLKESLQLHRLEKFPKKQTILLRTKIFFLSPSFSHSRSRMPQMPCFSLFMLKNVQMQGGARLQAKHDFKYVARGSRSDNIADGRFSV